MEKEILARSSYRPVYGFCRSCVYLAAGWAPVMGSDYPAQPAPELVEIPAMGVGRMRHDAVIHDGLRALDFVRWRDCADDAGYEWYYAESRLYIIRCKATGAIWNVYAHGPRDAFRKVSAQAKIYAWHDLKKNPEDLPVYNGQYLCCVNAVSLNGSTEKQYMILSRSQIRLIMSPDVMTLVTRINAWKEIEPFQKEGRA